MRSHTRHEHRGANQRGRIGDVCERSRTMLSNHATLAILFAILVAPLRGEVIESTAAGFI
ncbi:MAG: hypothetical protein DMF94_08940 [Acidobacteria bacterium]|nr:MAG: hypothetical protein DMF94_08940 [Acidobacteriota bacterium]